MDRKTLTGAVLAAAVGAMFLTSPVFAQDSSSGSSQAAVKCIGGNSCKGKNACKNQGFVMTSSADECTSKGGHPEEPKN